MLWLLGTIRCGAAPPQVLILADPCQLSVDIVDVETTLFDVYIYPLM